jgi:hypothetical protein
MVVPSLADGCHARDMATDPICARCGASTPGASPDGGLPEGWSLATSERGVSYLCAACTRENVRSIEARLDEDWW